MLPKVVTVFKSRQVIKRIPFRSKYGIRHVRRVNCQTYNAVEAIFQIKFQRLRLLFFRCIPVFFCLITFLFGIFLLIRFFLCFLFRFFGLFHQSGFFFTHKETVISLGIEEHDIGIIFGSPTAMAAISGTVARPNHRFSA